MPTVSFVTFCHPPHLERLHKVDVLLDILNSHQHRFDEVIVVHQRCRGIEYEPIPITEVHHRVVESEDWEGPNKDYAPILEKYGLPANDPVADEMTHGPGGAHYWKWHCINHLIGLAVATSDYIVFSDCDTLIIESSDRSWIDRGIELLERRRNVFCISPSDGARERLDQTMSQQLFLVNAERMRAGPLGLPWNGKFDAPNGPMQEYYFMLEGRIGRLLTTHDLYRYVLPANYRYWHYNPWEV